MAEFHYLIGKVTRKYYGGTADKIKNAPSSMIHQVTGEEMEWIDFDERPDGTWDEATDTIIPRPSTDPNVRNRLRLSRFTEAELNALFTVDEINQMEVDGKIGTGRASEIING